MLSINRYGFLYQQYLKQNKPTLYDGLEKSNQLLDIILKKQNEILEYRNNLYEIIERDNLINKNDYKNEEEYELAIKEYVEKQLNDKMKEFFDKDVKVTDVI